MKQIISKCTPDLNQNADTGFPSVSTHNRLCSRKIIVAFTVIHVVSAMMVTVMSVLHVLS